MVTHVDNAIIENNFVHVGGYTIHNMMQVPGKNKFWLFDNEYGLYVGYNYIYEYRKKLFWIQEQILKILCVFNEKTIKNIQQLASMESPYEYLLAYVRENDSLYLKLEASKQLQPSEELLFRTRFHERLKYIMSWIMFCSVL